MGNVFQKHNDKFTGVWSLVSWEVYDFDSPEKKLIFKPHGDNPNGKAVISKSGYSSTIMVPSACLEPLKSDDWAQASDEEVLRIGRNLTTYSGFVTLLEDENGGYMCHTLVQISNNPNWIGKQQVRRAEYTIEDGVEYMTLWPPRVFVQKVWALLTIELRPLSNIAL